MNKWILMLALAIGCGASAWAGLFSEEPGELRGDVRYYILGDGDFELYKNTFGVEAQWREWIQFPFGVGLAAGANYSGVKDDSDAFGVQDVGDFSGSATMLPLGGSFFYCPIEMDNWNLMLEAGLRYVVVSSDIEARNLVTGQKHEVKIDNGAIWLLAGDVEFMMNETTYLFGGAGYQGDLSRGKVTYNGDDWRDNSLRGMFVKLGMKFNF